jgi:predicted secreted protein
MTPFNASRTTLVAVLALAASLAVAETQPPPQGVLGLTASASVEVPRDVLQVTFSTSRDGSDANAVQAQLKQALDAALAEARKVARPGQLDVQTGSFSIAPHYNPKSSGISGWQGSAELNVEGHDVPAIAALVGRITTLTVARAGYALSREARERAEADVSGQAIARFRAKAADYAKGFGYAGWSVREVSVNAGDLPPPRPLQMRAMAATASSSAEELPVEAGRATVTVTVTGTIQMK